jgi:hypothetical protein
MVTSTTAKPLATPSVSCSSITPPHSTTIIKSVHSSVKAHSSLNVGSFLLPYLQPSIQKERQIIVFLRDLLRLDRSRDRARGLLLAVGVFRVESCQRIEARRGIVLLVLVLGRDMQIQQRRLGVDHEGLTTYFTHEGGRIFLGLFRGGPVENGGGVRRGGTRKGEMRETIAGDGRVTHREITPYLLPFFFSFP